MNSLSILFTISILITLVNTATLPGVYRPADQIIQAIFPDEYEMRQQQKMGKWKPVPTRCISKRCTLEEIYKIFGAVQYIPKVNSRYKDDKVSTPDGCPTGFVRPVPDANCVEMF